MKENIYDNDEFFNKYSGMERSKKGLEGAGEWATLKELLPSFAGKKVLDLGCGFGWHCKYAIDNGASYALGIDLSKNMINTAKERNADEKIEYLVTAVEDYDYPVDTFDIVISSLALHYVESIEDIFDKIYRTLKSKGVFVLSIEHPIFTASCTEAWIVDDKGNKQHWAIDNYFIEGEIHTSFLVDNVVKYHRTFETLISTLLNKGFTIKGLKEPKPTDEMLKEFPFMTEDIRRPSMLIIRADKD